MKPTTPERRTWWHRLFEPVDGASLAVFRVGFGLLLVGHFSHYTLGGRLERLFLNPTVRFTFPGFSWVEPLPDAALRALFWLLLASAAGIALGLFYRASCLVFAVGNSYVFLLDTANYNNHDYLLCLLGLVMAAVPAHRLFSLDARLRPRIRSDTVPAWSLWWLRFQTGVPYLFGALAKINADWLLRGEPMTMWLREGTEGPLRLAIFRQPLTGLVMAWSGFFLDLLAVPLLLWRRTRVAALLALLAFHLLNAQLFVIGVFPWLMIWAALLFFRPDWPRRLRMVPPRRGGQPGRFRPRAAVAALLGLWVAVQALLPFRHYLYPGWVDWTEEGHRFSWRMKLRDKRGRIEFLAVDPMRRSVTPLQGVQELLLTPQQRDMMRHDPDSMRQFARHLARDLEPRLGRVEIHVVSELSLNGHPPRPLIDPEVDLARAQRRPGGGQPWILPFERD